MIPCQGMQGNRGDVPAQEDGDQRFPEFVEFLNEMHEGSGFLAWSEKEEHAESGSRHPGENRQSKG